jgi:RNA polymerase sigma-70 factor (ECF subfamily)
MDELEAVSKLKGGDKQALNFFFNKYYNRLVAYIVTYNHDNVLAEDMVQQAFIKLWVNRERLDTTPKKLFIYYCV